MAPLTRAEAKRCSLRNKVFGISDLVDVIRAHLSDRDSVALFTSSRAFKVEATEWGVRRRRVKEEYSALYHELYVYSSDDVSILTGYSDDSTLVNEFLKIDQAYFDLRNKHYENSDDPEEWAVISAVLCCEKRLIRAEQKVVAKEMDSISKKITYIHKVDESMRAYFSILYRNEDNPF
jgi:hypothetical protein|eukprot:5734737-Prymnesium_polylepis.1